MGSTSAPVASLGASADLPGHTFILIDKTGQQRWYGDYPSMLVSSVDLRNDVHNHLAS